MVQKHTNSHLLAGSGEASNEFCLPASQAAELAADKAARHVGPYAVRQLSSHSGQHLHISMQSLLFHTSIASM